MLALVADVDGDADFDANDSFLIHLVNLSGTDPDIDQSKGTSPLSAGQIRANVSNLGRPPGGSSRVARRQFTPVFTQREKGSLYLTNGTPQVQLLSNESEVVVESVASHWSNFREWIDVL